MPELRVPRGSVPPVPMPTVGPPPGSVPPVPMPEALAPVGHKGDKYEPSAVYEGRAREALAEIERLKVGLGRLNAQARQKLTPGGKQYRHNKTARAAKVRELNRREDRIRLLHAIASENAVQAAYAKKYEGIAKTAREADATALKETNTLFDSIEKNITSADTVEKSLYLRAQKVREHASDEENQRIDEAIIAATEAVRGGAPSTDAEQTVDKEIAAVEARVKEGKAVKKVEDTKKAELKKKKAGWAKEADHWAKYAKANKVPKEEAARKWDLINEGVSDFKSERANAEKGDSNERKSASSLKPDADAIKFVADLEMDWSQVNKQSALENTVRVRSGLQLIAISLSKNLDPWQADLAFDKGIEKMLVGSFGKDRQADVDMEEEIIRAMPEMTEDEERALRARIQKVMD